MCKNKTQFFYEMKKIQTYMALCVKESDCPIKPHLNLNYCVLQNPCALQLETTNTWPDILLQNVLEDNRIPGSIPQQVFQVLGQQNRNRLS